MGRSGIVLEGKCYRYGLFWLVTVCKCPRQQVLKMLPNMMATIVNSICSAELSKTPYPIGMSVSCQGLGSQGRILYGIRLQCYIRDHIEKNDPKPS